MNDNRDSELFEIEDEPEERTSMLSHWDWFLLGSLAWLLFEVFTEPVLSIWVASIKFGWNDFANGLWLWRTDPNTRRGRLCLMFYAATGFWRITVMTLLLVMIGTTIMVIVDINAPQVQQKDQDQLALLTGMSMLIVGMSFLMSSMVTWIAVFGALWRNLRIWIDPTVKYSRRAREWPPRPLGPNQLSRVVTTAMIFMSIVVIVTSIVLVGAFAGQGRQPPGWVFIMPVVGMIGAAVVLLGGREFTLNSIAALSPQECWYDDVEDHLIS